MIIRACSAADYELVPAFPILFVTGMNPNIAHRYSTDSRYVVAQGTLRWCV